MSHSLAGLTTTFRTSGAHPNPRVKCVMFALIRGLHGYNLYLYPGVHISAARLSGRLTFFALAPHVFFSITVAVFPLTYKNVIMSDVPRRRHQITMRFTGPSTVSNFISSFRCLGCRVALAYVLLYRAAATPSRKEHTNPFWCIYCCKLYYNASSLTLCYR